MNYKIDAKDKILGRLATEIALLLRGKNTAEFIPNKLPINKVEVINTEKIRLTGKKEWSKVYWRYSGYPGGIKRTSIESMREKNPARILEKAVYGMLPKNRLRAKIMKLLVIK